MLNTLDDYIIVRLNSDVANVSCDHRTLAEIITNAHKIFKAYKAFNSYNEILECLYTHIENDCLDTPEDSETESDCSSEEEVANVMPVMPVMPIVNKNVWHKNFCKEKFDIDIEIKFNFDSRNDDVNLKMKGYFCKLYDDDLSYERFMNQIRNIYKMMPVSEKNNIELLLQNLRARNVKSACWQLIDIVQTLYKNHKNRSFEM
jgi:hypothetical protein